MPVVARMTHSISKAFGEYCKEQKQKYYSHSYRLIRVVEGLIFTPTKLHKINEIAKF